MNPAELFKVLSVETRMRILELLKEEGPLGVTRLAEILGVTPAAVSQHLRVLRGAGLVQAERQGYRIPYSIDEDAMEHCRAMLDHVCHCGCPGSGRQPRRGRGRQTHGEDLASLRAYRKELEREIARVGKKIHRLEKKED